MPSLSLKPIPRVDSVTEQAFQREYMGPLTPLVLEHLAAAWPATQKWTPHYLMDQFGDRQVKVYDAGFAEPGKHYMSNIKSMPFGEYLQSILTTSKDLRMFLYNIVKEIPQLLDDVQAPTLARGFSKRYVFMFFGCKGAYTPMHYDIDNAHVFHTVLYGQKRIVLFPSNQSVQLYRHPFTVRSYVDIDQPDFDRYPQLRNANGYSVTLNAGETLFIPSGYWHYVVYEEGGFGLSLRCPSQRLGQRLQGYYNLLVVSPIDRLLNRLTPSRWFDWKRQTAQRRANRLAAVDDYHPVAEPLDDVRGESQ